jgi:hypothetical protein
VRKGESIAVEFKLPSTALAVLDPDNRWTLFPGRYDLLVGGNVAQGLAGIVTVVDTPRAVRRTANAR